MPGGLIVFVIDEDEEATATLYDLDGRKRAVLAEGSRVLDPGQVWVVEPGRLAVFDPGEEGEPYELFVHDLVTGAVVAHVPIPSLTQERWLAERTDDGLVALPQWSTDLRVDVIDPKTGKHDTYVAPGCVAKP